MPHKGRQHTIKYFCEDTEQLKPAHNNPVFKKSIIDTYKCFQRTALEEKRRKVFWHIYIFFPSIDCPAWGLLLHHRSGSTQTIFFCSSQMTLRRLVSSEFWSHQESGDKLWYRHGSLSSSGSSLFEHASSCSSDRLWRWSFDLTSEIINLSPRFVQICALLFVRQRWKADEVADAAVKQVLTSVTYK